MGSDRHARVKAIFRGAVELDSDALEAFLKESCADASFQPSDEADLLFNIPTTDPVPISEAAKSEVPSELAVLLMDCLAKNPQDRPESVDEIAARLKSMALETTWSQEDAARWWSDARGAASVLQHGGDVVVESERW